MHPLLRCTDTDSLSDILYDTDTVFLRKFLTKIYFKYETELKRTLTPTLQKGTTDF